jgi:hypothetical protein
MERNPLDTQVFKLKSQIQVAQTVGDLASSLLQGMLNVEPDPKTSRFNLVSGRSAIKELIQIVTGEVAAVLSRLNELVDEANKAEYRMPDISPDVVNEIDFGITGSAIGVMSRLGNVGPHLVKAIEHLQKVNPNALPAFCAQVAHAVQFMPGTQN